MSVPPAADAVAPGATDPPAPERHRWAVVDIDGVLADVRHRLKHVERRPKDWAAFFAAAPEDPLLEEGAGVARVLAHEHTLVYLSGRPEHCRADTVAWMQRHDLPPGSLLLRRDGDRRPARITKLEVLRELARKGRVAVLVDDDVDVCEAARAAGFPVFQADWMIQQPALREAQEVDGAT